MSTEGTTEGEGGRTGALLLVLVLAAAPVYVFFDIASRFVPAGKVGGTAEENAALFPLLAAGLMAALLLVQLVRTLRTAAGGSGRSVWDWVRDNRSPLILFAIFIAYIAAFRPLGFLISTAAFAVLAQLALGIRRPLRILSVAAGLTGIVYVAFAEVLNLVLPRGDIFG